jgi:hypothetical protein
MPLTYPQTWLCLVGVGLPFLCGQTPPPPPRSLSVGIIFVSYALHVRYMPFLDPVAPEAVNQLGSRSALASGIQLVYVRVPSIGLQCRRPLAAWMGLGAGKPSRVRVLPFLCWGVTRPRRRSSTTHWRHCTLSQPCSSYCRVRSISRALMQA